MTTSKRKHRYKHVEGKRWIEVRVKNPLQLFDARDPAPFRERDLDDDFVEYVVSSAREFPMKVPLKLVIHVEGPATPELSKDAIREAIREYFSYRIDLQRQDLRDFLRRAQIFLALGVVLLTGCLALAQSLSSQTGTGVLSILREGLVIFGWVSVWKPIELILFDWYPLFERLRLSRKLMTTEIEVHFSSGFAQN